MAIGADPSAPPELGVEIVEVASNADLKQFIRLPARLHGDDPAFIAPLEFERAQHLNRARNPYLKRAEAAFFLARRDGRVVGRISAQKDPLHLQTWNDGAGQFGFLDAEDDFEVFARLLAAAEDWLRSRELIRARGPFSLSINDESGLLVQGFKTPPYFMMGHAAPYHGAQLETLGYEGAMDLYAYSYDVAGDPLPQRLRRLIKRTLADPDITVRPLDPKQRETDFRAMLEVFNDAWARNWGAIPFTEPEVVHLSREMKPLLKPDYVRIAELKGRAVGFALGLPNLNQAIADLGGRLAPFGWAKLAWRLLGGRVRSARMPLMGVRRELQGGPLGPAIAFALIAELAAAFRARGFREAELSWVLETNHDTRRLIEEAGGVHAKTYRVYEKRL